MKTNYNHLAIRICVTLIFFWSTGCNKFLDTTPADFYSPEEYFNTESDLNTALVGVYDPLGSVELYSYNISSMFGTEADEGYYNRSSIDGPQVYDYSPAHTRIRTTWQKLYEGIARANLLLANAHKPEMSNSTRNKIIGEAQFLRAYYYFLLVSNWGDVPIVLEPTESPTDNGVPRTSAKEVYEFILKEMTEAETKVGTIQVNGNSGRVSQSAVQGILARVCLYMAGAPLNDVSKYADAKEWAKKVMNSGHKLNPDYQQIFINYAQDKYDLDESIWEVEFWGNGSESYSEAGWVGVRLGVQTSDVTLGYRYGVIRTTEKYFRLFENGDLRRDWTIAPYKYVGKQMVNHTPSEIYDRDIAKWRREYELDNSTSLTAQNFPLLRYSDVLLMFAEAETRITNSIPSTEAIEAVNAVRRRGFGEMLYGKHIEAIVMNNNGVNYIDPPTVTISGGGGVEAEAVAVLGVDGSIPEIKILNKGTGFTTTPTITISGGGGTGATATVILSNADLPDFETASAERFLEAIKDERSRELGFEGLRKYDLIRWGEFLRVMSDMEIEISNSTAPHYAAWAFRNVSSKHLLFPIPIREMALNKQLTQNPGW